MIAGDQKDVCEKCIEWIHQKVGPDFKIGVSTNFKRTVTESMKFVGRSHTIDRIHQLFDKRWAERHDSENKMKHPVGIIGTSPGLGKTRTLIETSKLLERKIENEKYAWFRSIIITYNGGAQPRNQEWYGTYEERANFFALRLLFLCSLIVMAIVLSLRWTSSLRTSEPMIGASTLR